MDINELREIAEEEIKNPTFEITKQFLEVNDIERDQNGAYVCDMHNTNNEENTVSFYYRINGEKYFLCVLLEMSKKMLFGFIRKIQIVVT